MLVKIFLLALNVAVHDNATVVAHNSAWFETAGAHSEVRLDILTCGNLIRHQVLVVLGIGVCAQVHQEPSNVLRSSHGCEMKRRVTLLICDVWLRTMLEQELKDFITAVMTSSLKKWCTLVSIHFIDVSVSDNEPLTDI